MKGSLMTLESSCVLTTTESQKEAEDLFSRASRENAKKQPLLSPHVLWLGLGVSDFAAPARLLRVWVLVGLGF